MTTAAGPRRGRAGDLVGRAAEELRRHGPALALLCLMALFYAYRIDDWLINDDEEGYLYAAWRISQGDLPYRDFLTPQLPGFLFPGAAWVRLLGRAPEIMRAWSAVLTLAAGWATYLVGRRLFGSAAGLAAMVTLLAIDDVFEIARVFRPEATMLACATLALYVFVRADETGSRRGFAVAGLLFGLGLLAKLFGLLPWAAAAAYLGWGLVRREPGRSAGDLVALALPGAAVVAAVMGGFQLLTPRTYEAVLEHHLRQGAELAPAQVVRKTLAFYWRALNWHAPLLAFVPLGLVTARRVAGRRWAILAWQLATVLGFFLLTRQLWARHLVVLLPALALTFGAAVGWIATARPGDRRLSVVAAATVVAAVILPHLLSDLEAAGRREIGTARLATLVGALAPPGTRFLSDYPGIGFYAGRATTYSGAGISEGATESGQITGARLLAEMATGDVTLVSMDTFSQGGALADLVDYAAFDAGLAADYRHLGKFWRQYQPHSIYLRQDVPLRSVDFGWAELLAVGHSASVESGGTLAVDLVLRAAAPADRTYTAFLHLVGPDGATWGQGDGLLTNALYRATDEWEPGELVAQPLELPVEPGTPPGAYRLRLGLYDRETGERLTWSTAEGGSGDAYDVGAVDVWVPARPPDVGAVDVGADATTGRAVAGPYRLLASSVPPVARAGELLAVRSTWRAESAPGADHRLRLTLVTGDDATAPATTDPRGLGTITASPGGPSDLGAVTVAPGGPDWPTGAWRRGEIAAVRAGPVIDPSAGGGPARLVAEWLDDTGAALGPPVELGTLTVEPLDADYVTAAPDTARPVGARLGGRLVLESTDLPESAAPGTDLELRLYWRAHELVPVAYTVLVHVVDAAGAIVAQADGPPADGTRPTTSWRPGEVIADARRVSLPPDLPAGDYTVLAGLYDPNDPALARLPVTLDGSPRPDARVPLGEITAGR